MSRHHSMIHLGLGGVAAMALLAACDRADVWERQLSAGDAVALERVIAWPVPGRREVVLYAPGPDVVDHAALDAAPRRLLAGPDGRSLLALDEAGGATLLRFTERGTVEKRVDYDLGAVFTGVEWAADGRYAVFHHGGASAGDTAGEVVRNPNEIAILDLGAGAGASNPVRRTLRSFGAGPRAIVLSGPGEIGGAERRFAWALSDRYLALFDLARPTAAEVIVRFTLAQETREVVPVSVEAVPGVDGGAPGALVRAAGTDDLFLLSFADDAAPDVVPKPVLNALPGSASLSDTLSIVTSAGLRIFTLAGNQLAAVDPATGGRKGVTLPAYGGHLVPFRGEDGAPQALIWAEGQATVAFARLDEVEQARGRAVTVLTLENGIERLVPVPGQAAAVAVSTARLVVLDFRAQTATPFDIGGTITGYGGYDGYSDEYGNPYPTPSGDESVQVSGDGKTVYAMVSAESPTLVSVDLETGAAGAVELPETGRLMQLPGAGRVVVDHQDPLGSVTVLPNGDLGSLDAGELETHTGLFLTEVLDR
jgi:hypothetical protein